MSQQVILGDHMYACSKGRRTIHQQRIQQVAVGQLFPLDIPLQRSAGGLTQAIPHTIGISEELTGEQQFQLQVEAVLPHIGIVGSPQLSKQHLCFVEKLRSITDAFFPDMLHQVEEETCLFPQSVFIEPGKTKIPFAIIFLQIISCRPVGMCQQKGCDLEAVRLRYGDAHQRVFHYRNNRRSYRCGISMGTRANYRQQEADGNGKGKQVFHGSGSMKITSFMPNSIFAVCQNMSSTVHRFLRITISIFSRKASISASGKKWAHM